MVLNGQTWVQNDKKTHFIWCNTYLRNEGSIDSHLLYICVKISSKFRQSVYFLNLSIFAEIVCV